MIIVIFTSQNISADKQNIGAYAAQNVGRMRK